MTGARVAQTWEKVIALGRYGLSPGTVGWYEGRRYVYWWNFRVNGMVWRDLGPSPKIPEPVYQPWGDHLFHSRPMFEFLRR